MLALFISKRVSLLWVFVFEFGRVGFGEKELKVGVGGFCFGETDEFRATRQEGWELKKE